MSAQTRQPATVSAGPWFTDGHSEALMTADSVLGGFCTLMFVVALFGWHNGAVSGIGAAAVCSVFLINFIVSFISWRTNRYAFMIEMIRLGMGLVLAPMVSVLSDGALAPYWPVYVVMLLGSLMLLGITGQRILWSRLLILAHVGLLILFTALFPPRTNLRGGAVGTVNWYQLLMVAGVIAMVGLVCAEMMAMLGRTLSGLRQRSHELTRARDALFAELNVAHEIQTLLLPRSITLPGSEVTGRMVPASEVGGDYYDVLGAASGRSFLAVGDVSGHGLTSGLTMMMARTALLGILEAKPNISLVDAYRALNRCLRHNLARMDLEMYMTFVLLESKGQGRFEAVGQHLPLLIYRADTGRVEEVELEGVWLGLVDHLTPDMLIPVEVTLRPGDLLVLYTDGVVEHFAGREMFGFSRFKELLRQTAVHGPKGVIDATLSKLKDFSVEQKDDITLLVVSYAGEASGHGTGEVSGGAPVQPLAAGARGA